MSGGTDILVCASIDKLVYALCGQLKQRTDIRRTIPTTGFDSLTTDYGLRTTDGASRKYVTTFAADTNGGKNFMKERGDICSRNKLGA